MPAEINSRQDRQRDIIESIQKGESKTISLFPKELKRFQSLYPNHSFEKQGTEPGQRCKTYSVKVSLN